MIPSTAHYCYISAVGNKGLRFGYLHYLSVLLARRVAKLERVLVHLDTEPTGIWWDRSKHHLEVNRIDPPTEVFGNSVEHPAHRADLVRLCALYEQGGVYLDLDVLSLRDFGAFRECNCVLGLQDGAYGLCNAVVMAEPESELLRLWLDEYHDFDGAHWDEHSVRRPLKLASSNPHLVHIQPDTAFFWPGVQEPHQVFYDDERVYRRQRLIELRAIRGYRFLTAWEKFRTVTGQSGSNLQGSHDHRLEKLRQSFAVHLWESKWRRPYLERITPEWVMGSRCVLATRLREVLGEHGLHEATEAFL